MEALTRAVVGRQQFLLARATSTRARSTYYSTLQSWATTTSSTSSQRLRTTIGSHTFSTSSLLVANPLAHSWNTADNNTNAAVVTLARRNWTNNKSNNNKNNNKENKKKQQMTPMNAKEGRVAFQGQLKGKSNSKLCTGCGVEVIKGAGDGQSAIMSGEDALDGRSKTASKKDRYLDVTDSRNSGFLCARCKSLRTGSITKAYDALQDVAPSVFLKQLQYIVGRRKFAMCIAVVDATDPEHSAPKVLRKAIGNTPVLMVISKIDLLPNWNRHVQLDLGRRILKAMGAQSFVATYGVSSMTAEGIDDLAEFVLQNVKGRDMFVVGAANVGKSTLTQTLAASIAEKVKTKHRSAKKRLAGLESLSVTASHLPGTTLQAVRIPCFNKPGHALWDTPGLINARALQYSIFPSHLMEPLTRPEPIVDGAFVGFVDSGQSVLIEANWTGDAEEPLILGRIDITTARSLKAHSFLHPSVRVRIVPTQEAPDRAIIPESHVEEVHRAMNVPKAENKVFSKRLLPFSQKGNPLGIVTPRDDYRTPINRIMMDLVFASVGWINFNSPQSFEMIPHCVEGSVYSHRKSLFFGSQEGRVRETVDQRPIDTFGGSKDYFEFYAEDDDEYY